jgi:translocation and assembly module TamA
MTESGDEIRNVQVEIEERDRYTLTSGTSFSTSEGPGLTASLTRRNATRRGDTLTGAMTLATLERAFEVDWRIPDVTAFDRTLVLSADIGREETDAFDKEAISLSGAFEVRASRRLTYTLGAASEVTREEDAFEQRDQQILSTSLGVRLDYANDPLDATKGWRIDARGEPGIVIGDREAQYLSLNGQISAYQPLDREQHFVIATRLRSGFVYGAALSDLPVSRRFFAGGGGSARGFEFQSVGPRDDEGVPTGGRGLMEVSGELRWRRDGPLGFVAFLDGASVTENEGVSLSDVRYSAGLGVRYDTVMGPLRFDIATPLDPRDGDAPIQLYVSVGQAF